MYKELSTFKSVKKIKASEVNIEVYNEHIKNKAFVRKSKCTFDEVVIAVDADFDG